MADGQQRVTKVAQLPKKKAAQLDAMKILATFCYYFPGYTFAQARSLPYRRIVQMMQAVREEQAAKYLVLTEIAVAPHTDKAKGVKKLREYFKQMLPDFSEPVAVSSSKSILLRGGKRN